MNAIWKSLKTVHLGWRCDLLYPGGFYDAPETPAYAGQNHAKIRLLTRIRLYTGPQTPFFEVSICWPPRFRVAASMYWQLSGNEEAESRNVYPSPVRKAVELMIELMPGVLTNPPVAVVSTCAPSCRRSVIWISYQKRHPARKWPDRGANASWCDP